MALSGSFKNQFFREYGLEMDWTATQDIANNTSTVTCKLYLCSYSSSYTINSSATKSGYIQIDGTNLNFTTAGANLSGNQRKLLTTQTRTISHNSDGTKTAYLLGSYSINVTLSGVYHGTITVGGNASLNTIPRASTVSSNVSWTAGTQNLSITVNRASSSFTHQALLYVKNPSGTWIYIGETDINNKFGTSTTFVFNSTHITRMYEALGGYEYRPAKIDLRTYSGSTLIGTSTKETTNGVYGVTPATITFSDFDIGDSIPTTVRDMYSGFTYSAEFTFGAFTKTFPLVYTNLTPTFTFTPEEIQAMYNETPNSNSKTGNVFVSSKYNGIELNDGYPVNQNKSFTAYVTNSNPTMSDVFSYSDTNPETVTITNNNQRIIQNFSTVKVVIPVASKAIPKNGSSISQYIATLNGVEKIAPYSDIADVTFEFNSINAVVDQTLTIRCIDSRGNSDEKSKTVFMIPYSLPTVNATAKRLSGFERETTLKMNGEFSLLTIDGVNKNAIDSVLYRYKPTSVETYATWDEWQPFTWIIADNDYTATDVLLDLDNTISWHVEFMVTDVLGNKVFSTTVGTGSPILYIDNARKSIGVGKFVEIPHSYSLDVEGIVKAQGFYGEYNQDNAIVDDVLNGNITFSALGGSIYLGYQNTLKILQRADLYDTTGSKLILGKDGVFKGTVQLPASIYASQGGGLDVNNSDILGLNSVYFNDTCTSDSEAIQWKKSTTPTDSVDPAEHDSFRIYDGKIYLNSVSLVESGSNSNGNYAKFYDGLMICYGWIGGLTSSTGVQAKLQLFPIVFSSTPIVTATLDTYAGHFADWYIYNRATNGFTIYYNTAYDQSTNGFDYIAIGRWK